MECELKLLLPHREGYLAFLRLVGAAERGGVLQQNLFFDQPGGVLAAESCHLRLRSEQDLEAPGAPTWVVTAKGPKTPGGVPGTSMAVRPEEEIEVLAASAAAMRAEPSLALDALPASALKEKLVGLLGSSGPPLELTSHQYQNLRIKVPYTLDTTAGPFRATLEVDRTTYTHPPSGVTEEQFEIECEIEAARAAELAGPVEEVRRRRALSPHPSAASASPFGRAIRRSCAWLGEGLRSAAAGCFGRRCRACS
jgi:hypothetical protein